MEGFHERQGWHFTRREDGSVEITAGALEEVWDEGRARLCHVIPPDAWASIVASVSAGGEDSVRFNTSRSFHG